MVAAAICLTLLLLPGRGVAVPSDMPPAADGRDAGHSASPPDELKPLVLDELPKPLEPKRERTDLERDKLEALSMFSAARMLELDGELAEALRLYQRALRYDPEAVSIARAIIPLAIRLNRHAEAVRYALKAAELENADPVVLSRLGSYLADKGDWQRAAALYEKALAARSSAKPGGAGLLLEMQMGRLYHLTGQYEKAADVFARVFEALEHPEKIELDAAAKKLLLDEPTATYNLIGECFLLADRPEEATAAFERANHQKPDKGLLNYNLARVDAAVGKPEAALKRLNVCFTERMAGQGLGPYRLLADVLDDLDRQKELIGRLEKLLAEDPENVPLAYFLAEKYREEKRFEKAEPLYRELLDKTPTVTGYRALVEIYHRGDRLEPLLDVLSEAVEKTSALEPLDEEARAVAEDGPVVEKLLEIARRRYKADAKGFDYAHRLAVALLALAAGEYEAAGEFFDLAIQAKPEAAAELLLSWGLGLLVAEQYEAATAVFQRGIDEKALPDDNPVFYFYLAGALAMADQTDRALDAARKAAGITPDSPRFQMRVAWVLYHAERLPEAIRAYRELIERFDSEYGSSEVRQVLRQARLVLSNLYVLIDQPGEAQQWLEQVLDEFPEDASALNDLGYLWADADKNLRRAEGMIREALEAEPDNPAYRDSLGWVLYRLGRFDEAVAELEKAVEQEPDPVILDHLGNACQSAGKAEEALDAWRRALEGFEEAKDDEEALEVKKKINEHQ